MRVIDAALHERPVCPNRIHMWCYTVLVFYVAIREGMGLPILLDSNGFLDFQWPEGWHDLDPEHSNFPHEYLLPGNGTSMADLWGGKSKHTVFSRTNPALSVTTLNLMLFCIGFSHKSLFCRIAAEMN